MAASDFSVTNDDTILKRLDRWAMERPDNTALIYLVNGDTPLPPVTYRELVLSARAVAARLLRAGAGGECALLLYQPGLDFITGFLGCLYAGVVAIAVYAPKTNRNQHRLTSIIEDSGAAFALSTASELTRWRDTNLGGDSLSRLQWHATDDITTEDDTRLSFPDIEPYCTALLQYSSGSTGTPKGVMVGHGNLIHNLEYFTHGYHYTEGCVSVSWLPIFHDMGLVLGLLEPLYTGIPCVLMPPAAFTQKPLRWLQAISKYRATHSSAPNFAFDLCNRRITPEERATLDLSSWRVTLNGAEPVRKATLDEFTRLFAPYGFSSRVFCPAYGLAEATLIVTGELPEREPTALDLSAAELEQHRALIQPEATAGTNTIVGCGPTGSGMDLKIVDPDTGQPLPDKEVGEIWVRSASVCQGYWRRPKETEATFRALLAGTDAPYYLRTGDLGFALDGNLYVTGRIKDLIIVRGRNIYPQDIEYTAERCDDNLRAGFGAAFAITAQAEEQLVVAYEVERVASRNADKQGLIDNIAKAILDDFDVHVYDIVLLKTGTIPKTTSGKIQRAACRTAYLAGQLDVIGRQLRPVRSQGDATNRPDELTIKVVSIVSTFVWQIFGQPMFVTPESRIQAELGLDSIDFTVLLAKVEKELKMTMDFDKVLNIDTVNDLTVVVRELLAVQDQEATDGTRDRCVSTDRAHNLSVTD